MPKNGLMYCRGIMKRLPYSFPLTALKNAVMMEAGMEPRTINKYVRALIKIKWIETTQLNRFRKTNKGVEESEQQTKRS